MAPLNNDPGVDLQAVLPNPPPSLPTRAKVLWYVLNTIATAVVYQSFQYGQPINSTKEAVGSVEPDTWRKFILGYGNTASVLVADDQQMTFEVVNYTNGVVDNSWTDADYNNVEAALVAFATSIKGLVVSYLTLDTIKAYTMAFNAYPPDISAPPPKYNHFADSGAPVKVWTPAIPSTGTGQSAPQGCTTVTEVTPARSHWGRTYLPSIGLEAYQASGRLTTAAVDLVATNYNALLLQLESQGFHLVVPTRYANKLVTHTLQNVVGCRCDDVGDIIRRRRYRVAAYHKILP